MSAQTLDIAIIGMSGSFAGARNARAFWQNILNKVDAVAPAPADWGVPYFDPSAKVNDRIYTTRGGFLRDLAEFNPIEFGIMPSSADGGDPDHYMALKHARDALGDAGYLQRNFDRERVGVVLGRGTYPNRGQANLLSHGMVVDEIMDVVRGVRPDLNGDELADLRARLKKQLPPYNAEMVGLMTPNVIAGLIANRLDLMGPNFILDAACASSLIALEAAARELISGRCDMMISGGVQAQIPPQLYMQFCQINALSHGQLRPFQKGANGTLLGEGVGVLVLKRLEDAERDGDRIYAVIKGIGTSSDGKAKGLLAPRQEGEMLALRRAYGSSGIDPSTIGLVEAHATGIALGDRTEIKSLTTIFGPRTGDLPHIALGSVKSMISHCIPASGAAGTIKAALSLYHKILPPTLCDEVSPELEIEHTPFYINNEARPWVHGGNTPRRAGINSFGFGGVNAHMILEEYRPKSRVQIPVLHAPMPSELVLMAANSREALIAQCEQVLAHLRGAQAPSLAAVAKACALRVDGEHRLAIVCESAADLDKKIEQVLEKLRPANAVPFKTRGGAYYGAGAAPGRVCFLFPGEGAQYPNMLADLCMHYPQVREWFDFFEKIAAQRGAGSRAAIVFPAPTSLSSEAKQKIEQLLYTTDVAAEAVSAAALGLYELLRDLGINADTALGHSTGENIALVANGVRRLAKREEIAATVVDFNRLYSELDQAGRIVNGTLLTIGALKPDMRQRLLSNSGRMLVAMDNCPNQLILFGEPGDARGLKEQLSAEGAICAELPFGRAYHTALFKPVADAFRAYYRNAEFGPGHAQLYSAASAGPFPEDAEGIRELACQQWENPVRFTDTIERLYADGVRVFIEVGPSGNLTSFVTDTLRAHGDVIAVSCNSRRKSDVLHLHQTLAQIFAAGVSFKPAALFAHREIEDCELATAPKPAARPIPRINLSMPVMRFPSDWKGAQKPYKPTAAESEAQEHPNVVRLERAPARKPEAETAAVPAPAKPVAPAALPPSTAPMAPAATLDPLSANLPALAGLRLNPNDPRTPLLQAHLGLMQEFLESQTRILAQFAGIAEAIPTLSAAPLVATAAAATLSEEARYPLLGRIVELTPSKLVTERHHDENVDLYLRDHAIGSTPSRLQADLRAIQVIPFTFSMETVSEAAQKLLGAPYRVVELNAIRGHRWLTLDNGTIDLRIIAERQPAQGDYEVVTVKIFRLHEGPPAGLLVFEATARLATARPAAPQAFPWKAAQDREITLHRSDDVLYTAGMFHGPSLQCVKHLRRVADDAIEADLEILPTQDYFTFTTTPQLATEAALLDAVGQLAGYWQVELAGGVWDHVCFPYHVGRYIQYSDPLPPGSKVIVRGEILRSDIRLTCRFDAIGPDGKLILRLETWEDRNFEINPRFWAFRMDPRSGPLSRIVASPKPTTTLVHMLPFLPENFLDTGFAIWLRVVAHMSLNRDERTQFYGLPTAGGRREEWLMGRLAAKEALCEWARQALGQVLSPIDFEIVVDENGRPSARSSLLPTLKLPPLSISHSGRIAVAALTLSAGQAVGVDYQSTTGIDIDSLLQGAFDDADTALVRSVPAADQGKVAVMLWCAKEAAAKASGGGLQGRPRDWRIGGMRHGGNVAEPLHIEVLHGNQRYQVNLTFAEDGVLAICEHPAAHHSPALAAL